MSKRLPIPPDTILVPRWLIMEYNQRFVPNPSYAHGCYHCPYYDNTLDQDHECMKEGNACATDSTDLYLVPAKLGPQMLTIKMELES